MASIQEHGGKWRVQVYKNGHRASAVWDSKRKAQEWAARKEYEFSQLARPGEEALTYSAGVEKYLGSMSLMKKDGAAEWDRRRFESWADFFGRDTPLSDIDSDRIGEWRDWLLQGGDGRKPISAATVQRYANLLRSFMLTARNAWKEVDHHAFAGVKLPPEDNERELIWGWRQIRRVLRHCEAGGPKTRAMGAAFHIALRTALRLKEVLSARMDGSVILLDDSKTTRKGKPVRVPTTRQGRRVMEKYKRVRFDFTPNEGSTLFHAASVACGIRASGDGDGLTFHDSRATALTHMSRRMPVQVLQKISRHRDINVLTNRYYRESAESIAARL